MKTDTDRGTDRDTLAPWNPDLSAWNPDLSAWDLDPAAWAVEEWRLPDCWPEPA